MLGNGFSNLQFTLQYGPMSLQLFTAIIIIVDVKPGSGKMIPYIYALQSGTQSQIMQCLRFPWCCDTVAL